ncbi:radical SAM protein, partial [bacterium]|nr:radical SAM protein [bacterium]
SDNNFLKLLSEIEKVKPIHRVRLSSLNPDEINDEMIELVSASNTLCSHWHIATQSLSDNVLKGMKRRYNRSRFIDVVTKISHGSKGPFAIGTDIITGFPGESDNDFKDTYDALNDLPVDYMHVFPYSKRGKTPAAVMTNQVSDQIKDDRKKKLLELSIKKRKSFYNRYLDQTLEVIVENKKHLKTGKLRGISGNYIPILFDGSNSLLRSVSSVTITNVDETLTVFGELS